MGTVVIGKVESGGLMKGASLILIQIECYIIGTKCNIPLDTFNYKYLVIANCKL